MSESSFRRAEESLFDPRNYYTMANLRYSTQNLQSGEPDKDPAVMTVPNTTEAENWQFFHQGGRYYIRNYYNGADRQLGLMPGNTEKPQMRQRSGDLGQQWTVLRVGTDFVLINALYGPTANLSVRAGFEVGAAAGMYSGIGGDRWNITINPSAAKNRRITDDLEWLTPVKNVQSLISTSSSTNKISPSDSPATSPSPTSTRNASTSSQAMSGGAIAGIIVGAVVLLGSLIFILWFVLAKRRKAQPLAYTHTGPSPATEKYAYRSELYMPPPPPMELATGEGRVIELDSRVRDNTMLGRI